MTGFHKGVGVNNRFNDNRSCSGVQFPCYEFIEMVYNFVFDIVLIGYCHSVNPFSFITLVCLMCWVVYFIFSVSVCLWLLIRIMSGLYSL